MDIREIQSGVTGAPQSPRGAQPAGATTGPGRPTPAADSSGDQVTLSDQAQALQDARRAALGVPDVRTAVVDRVRAELSQGTLTPDTQQIARALLEQGIVSL